MCRAVARIVQSACCAALTCPPPENMAPAREDGRAVLASSRWPVVRAAPAVDNALFAALSALRGHLTSFITGWSGLRRCWCSTTEAGSCPALGRDERLGGLLARRPQGGVEA